MGEKKSRFVEAAIITAVFVAGAWFVNYSSAHRCNPGQTVTAKIERGPSRLLVN